MGQRRNSIHSATASRLQRAPALSRIEFQCFWAGAAANDAKRAAGKPLTDFRPDRFSKPPNGFAVGQVLKIADKHACMWNNVVLNRGEKLRVDAVADRVNSSVRANIFQQTSLRFSDDKHSVRRSCQCQFLLPKPSPFQTVASGHWESE